MRRDNTGKQDSFFFSFFLSETGCLYIVQPGLELSPSAGIIGVYHHS
jgi:hypothetical protein